MTGRRLFTDCQRVALRRAWHLYLEGVDWFHAADHGQRVTLASLERRGYLLRRPRRGDGVSRDSAFEYQIAPAVREAMRGRS